MPNLRNRTSIVMRSRSNRPAPAPIVNGLNDNSINPADMLPREEFPADNGRRFCVDFMLIFWYLFRISLIFAVSVNVMALVLEPTPIVKVYDYFIKPQEECDFSCKLEENANDLKVLQGKIFLLDDKLEELNRTLSDVQTWRAKLENEMFNVYNKTVSDSVGQLHILEEKIQDALSLYDADKLGMIDYALETAGGIIVSTPSTRPYPSNASYDLMGVLSVHPTSNPSLMIQPGTLPGQCFAFHGQQGRIIIKLAQKVHITSVSLEHAHPSLVYHINSCPKEFKVLGLKDDDERNLKELGSFTYKVNGKTVQTFQIDNDETRDYELLELSILSNYGHPDYTCVYRFRVHGNII